mgnify:CR=1 FL=1
MEGEEVINNLKSKHILNYIFSYVEDKIFKEKLFLYSKKLQIKFDIKLFELKENYLKKLNFDKCLYIKPRLFKKDILAIKYNKFLKEKKLNKEKIEKLIYETFENKEIKNIEEEDADNIDNIKDHEKLINIECPLFKIISKTKNFGNIFSIHISQKIIDEYKLKDEYIKLFDELNNLNIRSINIL